MKKNIQIQSIYCDVLFEFKKEDNTIKDTLKEAVKQKADLRGAELSRTCLFQADLRGAELSRTCLFKADLYGANLSGADLTGADLRRADLRFADLRFADLRFADLHEANLRGADLRRADLRFADLRFADLHEANLSGADLHEANLRGADLSGADLRFAHLCDADLTGADLSGADLRFAHLCDADLSGANLQGAMLRAANLRWAENVPFIPLNCPSEGSFIGWKKVEGKLVQLEIPEDAKRSSATTNKCRCDKAKVLSITDLDGKNPIDGILNTAQEHELLYKVGEMVYPDWFDEDRWHECSHGIHFFVNKQDAIDY